MSTILIVDDLAANREFLVTLLTYHGYRVLTAADGSLALASVRADKPDLVISDVLMPVMDGFELVRQLRVDPETSLIPVVFYTAHYGEREARELARSGGVAGVLSKPAESAEVLKLVRRLLSGAPVAGVAAAEPALTPEFDREHLRLLTNKLSEKTLGLRTANARLRALINIGLEYSSERDSAKRMQALGASIRDLFGATYVTLGMVTPGDRTVQGFFTCGIGAVEWLKRGDTLSGILAAAVADRRCLRGENDGGDPASLELPWQHPRVEAYLAVPIVSPTHVYGWICLVGNEGRVFTEDDEQLMLALSGQVGRICELEAEILDRQQAESAVRHERDRAQRYLDTAEIILLALDLEGRITLVNRYACSVLGWTAEELLGRNWVETCLPERSRVELKEKFHKLVGGDLAIVESPILTRSGGERLVEWRNTLLRDTTGQVVGTLSSGADITERKRAEELARRGEQITSLAAAVSLALTGRDSLPRALQQCAGAIVTHLEAATARVWTLDDREAVLELQASAGLRSPSEGAQARVHLGQSKIGRIARDRKPYLTNTVLGNPEISDQDWVRREKLVGFAGHPLIVDGRVVGVMAVFSRKALSAEVIAALASVAGQIALGIDRHRSSEAFRAAEERMRFALGSAAVGIWDMDYTTGLLKWSETLEAQYGLQPGTFDGTVKGFVERIHPDDRASLMEVLEKAMKSGSDFNTSNRSVWPDGTVRWLSGTGRIHLGAGGEPLRGVGISLDVTEHRTLEQQYQQAQKMDAIGRLAGGVAHDFNNLLTAILGYCELLLAGLDSQDPRRADVAEIEKAGTRAAGLTRQLLAFSRKQIIEPKLLDLNVVVAEMRAMLGRLIREDVKIVVGFRPELALVNADRGQVEQIVMNLALNARDAMPAGGTLTIETANVELDGNYASTHRGVTPGPHVVLTMTDTGTGMTPQVQARLFEPFFTTKEPGKGTGLGLATVHGIVLQSGGSINVYSEFGSGTSFNVYFPRAEAATLPVATPPPPLPLGKGETVLVVEDADGLRELARRLLEKQGYKVLMASNAVEALRLFEENPSIDVLLTDVVMPGSSGPELTRDLQKLRPGLKVLYMSGYTEDAIVDHGVLNPGVAFLHKPFTSDSLGRKLREVLEA